MLAQQKMFYLLRRCDGVLVAAILAKIPSQAERLFAEQQCVGVRELRRRYIVRATNGAAVRGYSEG